MQKIYLLRHAQSVANAKKMVSGSKDDSPLSELGRRQAELAGKNAIPFHFDLIVASPVGRAEQTAQIIAKTVGYSLDKIIVLPELRERDMGSLDGANYASIPQYDGNHEDVEGTVADMEPLAALYKRAKNVLTLLYQRPEQRILVVCHNGIGRMLQTAEAGAEPRAMYRQPRLSNAVIYRL